MNFGVKETFIVPMNMCDFRDKNNNNSSLNKLEVYQFVIYSVSLMVRGYYGCSMVMGIQFSSILLLCQPQYMAYISWSGMVPPACMIMSAF